MHCMVNHTVEMEEDAGKGTKMDVEAPKVSNSIVTLRPDSQLIPLKAMTGSRYVDFRLGRHLIREEALFRSTPEGVSFSGKLVASKIQYSRFVYLGVEYPDGTSVPFIPIANMQEKSYTSSENLLRNDKREDNRNLPSKYHSTQNFGSITSSRNEACSSLYKMVEDFTNHMFPSDKISLKVNNNAGQLECALPFEEVVRTFENGIWYEAWLNDIYWLHPQGIAFLMPKYTRHLGGGTKKTGFISLELYGMHITHDTERIFGVREWRKIIM